MKVKDGFNNRRISNINFKSFLSLHKHFENFSRTDSLHRIDYLYLLSSCKHLLLNHIVIVKYVI